MKFRIPSTDRNPRQPVETRLESLGRFGNYFFASGWIAGAGPTPSTRGYRFAATGETVAAESSFGFIDVSAPACSRFLDLFWVNDGYRIEVGPAVPVEAASGPAGNPARLERLREDDFEELLGLLKASGLREVWSDRIVFEIIRICDDRDKRRFFAAALDRVGWPRLNEAVLERLRATGCDDSSREYLSFLTLSVAGMDARYLPPDLRGRFLGLAAGWQVARNDRELIAEVVRQLARIDEDEACGFALRAITVLDHERAELADFLRHCFPQDSQWWLHHALVNPELGSEQVADALNCAGTAAATEGRDALAALCYEAAVRVDPAAQSPAWNAGWLRAAAGDFGGAAALFRRVSRHYTHQSLSTRWPRFGGLPWPAAPMDTTGFTLPEGVPEWPRITVVTPSYNQGHFIEETILSVLNQSYPNLQTIVVDGNSTDDTRAVLERYRDRIDHLIIEPDNGQTEAINKGLRLADGEIITWLNSDDLQAPGALHTAALRWLDTRADLIAGICIEHIDRRMLLLNKPAASDSDFNTAQLARIFTYWLKGFYFYQPELFFSRRALDEAGPLDESLYYSMDYDLWMRFAKAGASLEVVDWPFAFFRKHESQKTTSLVDCVEEQSRVRERHHPLRPTEEREHRVRRMLAALRRNDQPLVGVLTKRRSKIFSETIQAELDRFGRDGFAFHLSDDERDPRIAEADLVILLAHVQEDPKTVAWLREARPDRPLAAWFWDNHHHLFENHETAAAVDLVFPGHALYGEYLRNDQSLFGGHVPLCVTQWSRPDAAAWFAELDDKPRSPDLYGGFVEYVFEPARTGFLRTLMDLLPHHALSILSEANLGAYFGRGGRDRFVEWCGYQTSLILPLRNDLSQRVFDALLAGQIPLVPEEIKDLDQVIPPDLQDSLPVIRFRMKDPAGAAAAHQEAVRRFAAGGAAGVRARHLHALEHHMFSARINRIVDQLLQP